MSDLDGRLEITWPNTVTLAQLADEMDFEALVPVARWRGFGGATDPQGPGFETFTWAAGIAAATRHSGVISTSHVALNHPIIAAKQSTVIDHISNGRYTLNVVNGWNFPEMEMFGVSLLEHEDRYACAEEWVTIVKRLWRATTKVRLRGQVLSHQGRLPAAETDPVAAPRHHECRLVRARPSLRLQALRSRVHQYPHPRHRDQYGPCRGLPHARAGDYGREVRVWTNATIVQAETEKEARDFYHYYVHEKGDWVAARNVIDTMAAEINKRDYPPERRNAMAEMMISGWGGFPLIGTKEQIVDGLATLSKIGLDGVLLSWPRYIEGMREFRDVTYPLLKQTGLRDQAAVNGHYERGDSSIARELGRTSRLCQD